MAAEAAVLVSTSSRAAVDVKPETWLSVGDGVGEVPGESRLQICSSSSRPAVEDE